MVELIAALFLITVFYIGCVYVIHLLIEHRKPRHEVDPMGTATVMDEWERNDDF